MEAYKERLCALCLWRRVKNSEIKYQKKSTVRLQSRFYPPNISYLLRFPTLLPLSSFPLLLLLPLIALYSCLAVCLSLPLAHSWLSEA